ncbi:MAG: glycine--tRNA ligase [Patescibacteria group bacterium]
MEQQTLMEQVTTLAKARGFVYPGSAIYGGLANSWDYGPLGVEMKNNIKRLWWQTFVHRRADMVGLDAGILMNPRVWEASGHVGSFTDPLVDCKACKQRFRGDKLLEERLGVEVVAVIKLEEVQPRLMAEKIACPSCKKCDWTEAKRFNLMFKTHQGVIEGEGSVVYLRPETAQGIFVNFKNVMQTHRPKMPFGIAQIGKAFRNEITPGNFTFRTREFEQMEIEYFFDPEASDWKELFEQWKRDTWAFLTVTLGIKEEKLRFRDHEADELSHYSRGTTDVEYNFPWGWGELCAAAAYRTDFDLTQHSEWSGEDLRATDPTNPQRKFMPHVIEPSFGADRVMLATLLDAYEQEAPKEGDDEGRTVLRLAARVAPYTVAVLPLSKKDELAGPASEVVALLREHWVTTYDETQSIGKRYRRQDEIGTPFCVTVDFDTLNDNAVTVRDRDTMTQERVAIAELVAYLRGRV